VQPSGAKAFVTVARNPSGKQIWSNIGATDILLISEARDQAREVIKRVRAGLPAFEAPPTKPDSFEGIAEQWIKRHAEAKALVSLKNIKRLLRVHVYGREPPSGFSRAVEQRSARRLGAHRRHGSRATVAFRSGCCRSRAAVRHQPVRRALAWRKHAPD
jgi:hypothetical protein